MIRSYEIKLYSSNKRNLKKMQYGYIGYCKERMEKGKDMMTFLERM